MPDFQIKACKHSLSCTSPVHCPIEFMKQFVLYSYTDYVIMVIVPRRCFSSHLSYQ